MLGRTSRALALAFACSLSSLAVAPAARANGRFPAANQLEATPGNDGSLVLRTTFGILFSNDGAKTWDWVCERGVGYGGIWDPPIGLFADGSVIAGTIDGLVRSPGEARGCTWSFAKSGLEKRTIVDVVVRPDAPNEGLVLASTGGENDAGGSTFTTEIFATIDAGRTFTALAKDFDPLFVAQTIEVAKSDPKRVYVSGSLGDDGAFYVSTDGGTTFTKHVIALVKPDERAPYIAAVSPTDAGRVYVRTGGRSSRLLVTDDGGVTFRSVFQGPPLAGFALSADGATVWVGSTEGVSRAATADFAFTKLGSVAVQCLKSVGATLYACIADPTVPYALGASSDRGATFAPVLSLVQIRGPLACAAGTEAAMCAADWPALKATFDPGATTTSDAGGAVGPKTGGGPATGAYAAGGGCALAGAPGRGLGAVALVAAAVTTLLRRRRPRK